MVPSFFLPFLPSNRLACFAPVLHIEFPDGTTLISCEVGLQFGSRAMNIIHKRAIHMNHVVYTTQKNYSTKDQGSRLCQGIRTLE